MKNEQVKSKPKKAKAKTFTKKERTLYNLYHSP